MKRRVFTLFLALVLLVSTAAVAAPAVSAADYEMKASDKIVDLIKSFEGFTAKPKEDVNGLYTIGYGTTVDPALYPNGITTAQAEKLLRDILVSFEVGVNNFAKKHSLKFSQQQFDALVSFTYNVGGGWFNSANYTTLRSAILNGATGSDFIYAMTLYCNAGGKMLDALRNRRLIEAKVYLTGNYTKTVPANYDYVLFSDQMEGASGSVKIQGFDSSWNTQIVPVPSKSGYRFLGWYTAKDGGEWVTDLNASHAGKTLYGHWQQGNGSSAGTAAKYNRVTTAETAACSAPNGKTEKTIAAKTTISITADFVDGNGVKWGKTKDGWVELTKTRAPGSAILESNKTVELTVNTNGVNIRKGPGTNYDKVGTANKGDKLTVTQVQRGVNYLWGKFDGGWICLDYTNYESQVDDSNSGTGEEVIATGVVVKTKSLNIRNRPGTSGTTVVGTYKGGDTVSITAKQKVGNVEWGKTNRGWISLYYVELKAPGSTDEKPDEDNKEESKPETEPGDEKVSATGIVVGTNTLNIRNNPGTSGTKVVGTYDRGDLVTITAQQKVGKTTWGLTAKGWISLYYVELSPVDNGSDDPNEQPITTGVIVDCITLRVRQGPGTNYRKVGSLAAGTEVKIYATSGHSSNLWGKISGGWISMNYVELDGSNSNDPEVGTGEVGVVYNCKKLNVREKAGTNHKAVARIDKGTKVEIYETTEVKGVQWGRISLGWVSMEYIKMEDEADKPETEKPEDKPETENPETKPETPKPEQKPQSTKLGTIVKTTEVRIRAGAGTQYDKVGTLKKGDRVVILETAEVGNATWGRIDKGWIHMYYVQVDTTKVPEGAVYKTVTTSVNIRVGAGTNYDKAGKYSKGDIILVYEQTEVDGRPWGRTDKGWLCLEYVK